MKLIFFLTLISLSVSAQQSLTISRNQTADLSPGRDTISGTPVFSLIGQSNAEGRVSESSWGSAYSRDSIEWITAYDTTGILKKFIVGHNNSPAAKSNGYQQNGLDVALYPYLRMIASNWYLFKLTRGGTGLLYYTPGGYFCMIPSELGSDFLQAAKTAFTGENWQDGFTVWLQGENEASEGPLGKVQGYSEGLDSLYQDYATIIGVPNPFWVTVGINDSLNTGTYPFVSDVITEQETLADSYTDMHFVSSAGLATSDGVHFTAESFEIIAKRIYNVLYQRIRRPKIIQQ